MPYSRVWPAGLCLVVVSGALTAGCQKAQPPIVGKWQMSTSMPGGTIVITREFRPDGTETMSGNIPNAPGYQATYTVNGSTLTETVSQMTVNGNTIKTTAPSGGPQAMVETYAITGDTLTVTTNAGDITSKQTYQREKTQ